MGMLDLPSGGLGGTSTSPPPPSATTPTSAPASTTSPYVPPGMSTSTSNASSSSWSWSDGQWGLSSGGLADDVIIWGGAPQPGQQNQEHRSEVWHEQVPQYSGDGGNMPGQFNPLGHSTALQAMNYFMGLYGSDRPQFNGVREMLANAGYYGSDEISRVVNRAAGTWDADALHKAMLDYTGWSKQTGSPTTFVEWLQGGQGNKNLGGNSAMGSYGGGGGAGGTVSLTDPSQITMYAQRAARASLGQELTPDQLNQFISQFHTEEQANQTAAMTGAAKVNSSDARSESIQYIKQNFQPQMEQHESQGYMNALLNLFLPNQDQRSAINTDPNAVSY